MNLVGHQKLLPAFAGPPLVAIGDWLFSLLTSIPIPDKIETALIALLTGLGVFVVPHGGNTEDDPPKSSSDSTIAAVISHDVLN